MSICDILALLELYSMAFRAALVTLLVGRKTIDIFICTR